MVCLARVSQCKRGSAGIRSHCYDRQTTSVTWSGLPPGLDLRDLTYVTATHIASHPTSASAPSRCCTLVRAKHMPHGNRFAPRSRHLLTSECMKLQGSKSRRYSLAGPMASISLSSATAPHVIALHALTHASRRTFCGIILPLNAVLFRFDFDKLWLQRLRRSG